MNATLHLDQSNGIFGKHLRRFSETFHLKALQNTKEDHMKFIHDEWFMGGYDRKWSHGSPVTLRNRDPCVDFCTMKTRVNHTHILHSIGNRIQWISPFLHNLRKGITLG